MCIVELVDAYREIKDRGIDFLNKGIVTGYSQGTETVVTRKKKAGEVTSQEDLISFHIDEEEEKADPRFAIHRSIFKSYADVKYVVQLDTRWCSILAQENEGIPPLSYTHAAHFHGEILCVDCIDGEINPCNIYSTIGSSIISKLKNRTIYGTEAVLIKNMGGICWGHDLKGTLENYYALEELAFRAYMSRNANGRCYNYLPYPFAQLFWEKAR